MKLIIYGIIIGIAKVIPGISGSLLAISFGIYEKTIHIITHFFDDFKNNLIFIIKLGIGIIIGIVLLSKIVLFFITNYYFYSMMLFIGLIISTIIKNYKDIKINYLVIFFTILVFFLVSCIKINIRGNYVFFIGGIIEIFSSLIPGISGTSLFISLGIYNDILLLISNLMNIRYVTKNYINYLFYFIGMFISFIGCSLLIDYLYQNHKNLFDNIILGLSVTSIISLFLLIYLPSNIINILIGFFLFIMGIFIGFIS